MSQEQTEARKNPKVRWINGEGGGLLVDGVMYAPIEVGTRKLDEQLREDAAHIVQLLKQDPVYLPLGKIDTLTASYVEFQLSPKMGAYGLLIWDSYEDQKDFSILLYMNNNKRVCLNITSAFNTIELERLQEVSNTLLTAYRKVFAVPTSKKEETGGGVGEKLQKPRRKGK